jgi:hypothetical protein
MTAQELIAGLRAMVGPQEVRVIFHYLANHAIEARLAEGQRITDVSDVVAWLRELAEAAKESEVSHKCDGTVRTGPKVTHPPEQSRWGPPTRRGVDQLGQPQIPDPDPPHRCEDCFHVHSGRYECTEYLGEGRFCKCSSKAA